jgi:hypothetical protein
MFHAAKKMANTNFLYLYPVEEKEKLEHRCSIFRRDIVLSVSNAQSRRALEHFRVSVDLLHCMSVGMGMGRLQGDCMNAKTITRDGAGIR